ncbi:MHS family MFS transporter [Streptomyces sp. NBC_00873]|uniref:MFS transporter n=1 Tax=unclassified Streptomyces TaxID=2593676 RepID=UPI00386A49CE|nr:MHS family MFS transporter [Streptomyces sp. NBC_00873]WTA47025.1 MHS family MFS transporter [Streptomyces sp. NBC_00842]
MNIQVDAPHTAVSAVSDRKPRIKALAAAISASAIEYYDFMIYGTAAALIFHGQFFPEVSPTTGVLASFATFAVGFAARPLGAAVFGHIGDRHGRKPALVGAMVLMGVASTLIGLLPNFAMAGIIAPLLLVLLRVAQGMAVGGQWGGASLLALEHAPPNRRGLYGAIPQLGVPFGMITGNLVFILVGHLVGPEAFDSWGWRIPFLLSIVMLPLAYAIHRNIEDSPEFRRAEQERQNRAQAVPKSSLAEVLRRPKAMLLAAGTFAPATISFYIITTGMLDYGVHELGMGQNTVLTAVLIAMSGWTAGTIGFAALSDKVGRRPVFAAGAVVAGAWSFVVFPLANTRELPLLVLGLFVGLAAVGAMQGPAVAMFAEMFPPQVRYTGASLGHQMANIVGGGWAPLIMVALLGAGDGTFLVSAYGAAAAVLGLIPLALLGRLKEIS